jgi:hypothetical protein
VLPNVRFLTFAGHQRNVFADTKSAFTPNDVFTTVIRLVIISGTATSQVAGVVRPVGKLGTSAPHMFRWPHRCDPMFRSMKRHRTWALSNLSGSPSRSPIRDHGGGVKKKKRATNQATITIWNCVVLMFLLVPQRSLYCLYVLRCQKAPEDQRLATRFADGGSVYVGPYFQSYIPSLIQYGG